MCGRYTGNDGESDEIAEIYRRTGKAFPDAPLKTGEIFPTDRAPVVFGSGLQPMPAVWGFPGFRGKGVIINARAETAAGKVTFRDSFLSCRCAVPTTGYLEWDSRRVKYRFRLPEARILWLGGFFKPFPDGVRFVILTTAPNASVADIHDRMPIILPPSFLHSWTSDTAFALDYLSAPMPALAREAQ